MQIENVWLVCGDGAPARLSSVVINDEGVVTELREGGGEPAGFLVPAAVDLHLDNVLERRRPRATVDLDPAVVIASLDAECAANGIGTVCIAARCEESPGQGILAADAVRLASAVESLAPRLACDWRVHARVEVTDAVAIGTLAEVLGATSRVALVSVMEHTLERSRFASAEEHRTFYAKDWGMSETEVDAILNAKRIDDITRAERRAAVAQAAHAARVPLASHDDRTAESIADAARLGATLSEFPLTTSAARAANEHGMVRVLGAPNAVRGRSTSPGNLLASDAVREKLVDALCSDYLPMALMRAPFALSHRGLGDLGTLIDLISLNPARAIGLSCGTITVGQALSAALLRSTPLGLIGVGLWRDGRQTFAR